MNADTCAVLASVFPLILITTVLESRVIHFNLRRRRIFRWSTYTGIGTSVFGLAFTVIGVTNGGFGSDDPRAALLWGFFWFALAALALTVIGIGATLENEDDAKAALGERGTGSEPSN